MKNQSLNQFNFSKTDRQRTLRATCQGQSVKEMPAHGRGAQYQSWKQGWWYELAAEVVQEEPAWTNIEEAEVPIAAVRETASVWSAPPSARANSVNMSDLLAPFGQPSSAQPEIVQMTVESEEEPQLAGEEIESEEQEEYEIEEVESEMDYIDWTIAGARKSAEMRNNVIVIAGLKSLLALQKRARTTAEKRRNAQLSSALREMIDVEEEVITNEDMLNRKGERLLFGVAVNDSDAPNYSQPASTDAVSDPGVHRSVRGTIELVLHPTGRKITPRYNGCGMLVRVDLSDGAWFERARDEEVWRMRDQNGRETLDQPIVSLSFDRIGNLSFITMDGARTTFYTNGMISVDEPGKSASA